MKSSFQISVIVLTAFATVGVGLGLGSYTYYAKQTGSANLLNAAVPTDTSSDALGYDTRLAKGDKLFASEQFTDAENEYNYAVKIDAQNPKGFTALGKVSLALHQNPAALENFKTAYTLSPNAETAANYAHLLMISEQWPEAEKILSSIGDASQELLYERALYNVMQNHPDQAKTEFQSALSASGSLIPATLQSFIDTYQNYDTAQGAEPTYLKALLCKTLIDAKEYELTASLAHQVLNEKNDYRDVWMLLGYASFKTEKYSDAEDAFKEAKRIDSVKPEVHYFLGSTYSEEKKYQNAIDELELALLYGFSPAEEAYKKIADNHEALSEWTEAVAAYEALLNLNPSTVKLFEEPVKITLNQLHDTDRALTLAQKALTFFPSEALSHTLLAQVYLAQGQLDLAGSSITTALEIDTTLALAHFTAGQVRDAQKNTDSAKWEYKKTFDLTDASDPLHNQAAEAYNKLITTPVNPAPQP